MLAYAGSFGSSLVTTATGIDAYGYEDASVVSNGGSIYAVAYGAAGATATGVQVEANGKYSSLSSYNSIIIGNAVSYAGTASATGASVNGGFYADLDVSGYGGIAGYALSYNGNAYAVGTQV